MMNRYLFICLALVSVYSSLTGQNKLWRLSLEASASIGTAFNKGSAVGEASGLNYELSVHDEQSVLSGHWTIGLGYHFSKRHSLWLRFGVNDLARRFDATTLTYFDDLSQYESKLGGYRQRQPVDVWRTEYEYSRHISKFRLLGGCGYQLQRNLDRTYVIVASESFHPNTHAVTAFAGIVYPLFSSVELTGRFRVINTLRSRGTAYLWIENDLDFSPLQVVAELGLRWSFAEMRQPIDVNNEK